MQEVAAVSLKHHARCRDTKASSRTTPPNDASALPVTHRPLLLSDSEGPAQAALQQDSTWTSADNDAQHSNRGVRDCLQWATVVGGALAVPTAENNDVVLALAV